MFEMGLRKRQYPTVNHTESGYWEGGKWNQLCKSHRKWLLGRKEMESHFPFVPETSALHHFSPNKWSPRKAPEGSPAYVGVMDRKLQGG